MNTRILLIGQGIFLDGLTRILQEQAGSEVIGAVGTWEAARDLAAEQSPDIIIVDHEQAELRETDLAPLFESQTANIKVIYLTLSANQMVIHNRQQLANVSLPELIRALNISGDNA